MSESAPKPGRSYPFRTARRVVQGGFWGLFAATALFSFYRVSGGGYDLASPVSVGFWPKLSVFSAAVVSAAGRVFEAAFWPALLTAVSALLAGRWFCGWVCPLGASIDALDRAAWKGRGTAPSRRDAAARRLKYYVLAAGLAAAAAGSAAFTLLDPLSMAVRAYAAVLDAAVWLAEGIAGGLSAVPGIGALSEPAARLLGLRAAVRAGAGLAAASVMLLVLLPPVLLALSGREEKARRTWCRYGCPLGAVLALLGQWAAVRRRVSDACVGCNRCLAACPAGCILDGGKETLAGECILCGDCQAACPAGAVSFLPGGPSPVEAEVDLSRRGVVAGLLAGLWAAAAGGLSALGLRKNPEKSFLRPPGAALAEKEFLDRCLRCGACARVCPNGALHLDFHRAGLEGLGAPVLVPRLGYCEYECNLCGRVCPSEAIPELPLKEKKKTPIGVARFDTTRCLPWVGRNRLMAGSEPAPDASSWLRKYACLTCEENCPVPGKAIKTVPVSAPDGSALLVPFVEDSLCIGCGRCEFVCPLEGEAGIRVLRWKHEVEEPAASPGAAANPLPPSGFSEGWKLTKTFRYRGEELFDYIDGAAVVHMAYGFREAFVGDYSPPSGAPLTAEAYLCDTPEHAYALFTTQRSGRDEDRLGGVLSESGGATYGVKGNVFFSVRSASPDAGGRPRALSEALLRRIPGGVSRPEVLSLLPPGFSPGSDVVLLMPEVAENFVSLPFLYDAGLGTRCAGALASFGEGPSGATIVVLSFERGSPPDPGGRETTLSGRKVRLLSSDPFTVAWRDGPLLLAVSGRDPQAVERLLRQVRLPRPAAP